MASLRRPSSFFPSKQNEFSAPRPRLPLPGDKGRKRDARKSKVDEKMKTRRMSMRRYGDSDFLASDPYQFTLDVAPPIPEGDEDDQPHVSGLKISAPQLRESVYGGTSPMYDDPMEFDDNDMREEERDEQIGTRQQKETEWDFSELRGDGVDVASYIRKVLTGADEDEKRRFITALKTQKDDNARDLRKTVVKNYDKFVSISKEISTLENDMLELKELLTEWKSLPQLMGMDDTLAPTINKDGKVERKGSRRNSPLDLQQMYRSQLTNLWSTIEGSQKYLPLAAGRHLVLEAHSFVELNAATYKAKQNVSLFLLNDLLLVAGRRRLKSSAATSADKELGRMVAEKCWVLADITLVDLKDSGELTNALKVKRGKEVCLYRAAKPEDKKAILAAFRQVSQELATRRRKENEAEQERRRTLWQGDAAVNARMTRMSMFMNLEPGGNTSSNPGTSLTDSKDLLWIDEFGDDLTMAISTHDWDESVTLVERGNDLLRTVANNVEATNMLTFRLESLRPTVVEKIAHDLSSPDNRKASAARLIALLTRLDRGELARDTFLQARHNLMVRLVRSIKHEGDISLYINELAVVCFTIIRHTSDWYINAFKDNRMASGFVNWARVQIEYFMDVFRRQVYTPTVDPKVVGECLDVTMSANRKYLRDIGLDFTFLLESLAAESQLSVNSGEKSNRQTAHGFRTEMPSPFVPSISKMPPPSPGDLSTGPTAPLSIRRQRSDHGGGPPPSSMRDVSNSSMMTNGGRRPSGDSIMSSRTGSRAVSPSAPRPPPRSERRSRPPPARVPDAA